MALIAHPTSDIRHPFFETCPEIKSFSPATTAKIATTSPRRTAGCIPSAWSGRSTAPGATSTSCIRKPSNRGYHRSRHPAQRGATRGHVLSGRGRGDEEGDVAGQDTGAAALDRRDRAVAVHRRDHRADGSDFSGNLRPRPPVATRGLSGGTPVLRNSDNCGSREQGAVADCAAHRG